MSNIKVGDTVIIRKPVLDENGDIFVEGAWRLIESAWCEKVKPKKSDKKRIKKLEKKIKRLNKTVDMLLGDYLDKYMDMLL